MDYTLLAMVVLVAAVALGASANDRRVNRLERRLARMELKLDAIAGHLGVAVADPAQPQLADLPEVRKYLQEGKKIQAIKAYRESTGAGLKDAKDAVERML
ncbi:ribosomal protein L7/L12 [Amycolatopsis sp., V23-08]|uniref:Ribosomal protein L7/L12 n=1 Tax=Amycolatopsis heterodermiae TaxID=3110235 RepID=A0ABU5R6P8_9PSEU|nr:ribosomal protein L7/L12 [Amycolatopsis sp., V23-08]MEA5361520.1 ribosomal protein L7/L12 [Amycolatopsis sp., V23-08]